MEEGLRHAGLAGVVGEVARLSMTASRRLQLAAEASGVTAFVIRRWRTLQEAEAFGQPTAAMTRWRITALPSAPLPVPGIGRARWRLELVRVRGGEGAVWDVEACDAQGRLAVPSDLADRPAAPAEGRDAPALDEPLVIAGHDGRRRVVAAADQAAQALGVRPGLPLAEAQARVPGLHVAPCDPAADAAALERLAAWAVAPLQP